nr:hypothetical protein [Desulfobacula sp.]
MKISGIYQSQDPGLLGKIRDGVREQLRTAPAGQEIKIFFRADDIAAPSKNFSRMMGLFLKYQVPLCLAVVPAWLTPKRWEAMAEFREKGRDLFCWHMHGYRHMNYEPQGKKQEFGPARTARVVLNDLIKGRERLETIMGKDLTPVFTPPWNRCSRDALMMLKKPGSPPSPEALAVFRLRRKGFWIFPFMRTCTPGRKYRPKRARKSSWRNSKQGWPPGPAASCSTICA